MKHLSFVAVLTLTATAAHAQTNPAAPIRLLSLESGDAFGFDIAPAGDVDGDGDVDLLVGAPDSGAIQPFGGRAYLFESPLAATATTANAANTLSTRLVGDMVGGSVAAAGDVNGDGLDDVLVGARGTDAAGGIESGRAYLFLGPVTERQVGGADAIITGLPSYEIGGTVARAGDLNDDGFDDIIVGSNVAGPAREGRLYIFHGPVTGSLGLADADAVLIGELPEDDFGISVAAPGDLNGDGFADLVVGASRTLFGGTPGPGRVFVFHGPFAGAIGALSAQAILTGELPRDSFGQSLATGDVNGDGVTDLVVGADQLLLPSSGTGKVYIFHGPLAGPVAAANAQARIVGDGLEHWFGNALACADLDQDGKSDVVVGAPGSLGSRLYAFRSPILGAIAAFNAQFIATAAPGEEFGRSVATADVDGDGRPDVIAGGPSFFKGAATTYVVAYTNALPPLPAKRRSQALR